MIRFVCWYCLFVIIHPEWLINLFILCFILFLGKFLAFRRLNFHIFYLPTCAMCILLLCSVVVNVPWFNMQSHLRPIPPNNARQICLFFQSYFFSSLPMKNRRNNVYVLFIKIKNEIIQRQFRMCNLLAGFTNRSLSKWIFFIPCISRGILHNFAMKNKYLKN